MSRTIDQKVVEMRFDNSDFERNVSHSMSTLDKLKNALNFSGAEKSFSGITSAANKVDFKGLHGAIDDTGHKFSALETIATGAFMRIGASISDYVTGQLKSLTIDQVTAGFDKYATKTKAVQTIMAATGLEIEEVSDQLDRLNWFTDETSYNFSDMVTNIAKFTSNGVELSEAVTAMEGISNWAAVSGQGVAEAGRAMYNLSQALGSGVLMVRDWMSIENASMATKEFKEEAIKAAVEVGTLAEVIDDMTGEVTYRTVVSIDADTGEAFFGDEVNYKTMRDSLKDKWFNSDVLIKVLNRYGAFTDELSKYYEKINENDGISVTTSQIIRMVNQYVDGTLDFNQAMQTTGMAAEELSEMLEKLGAEEYALGRKSLAAAQEAKTFKEAIDATKDAVSTSMMNMFEIIFGNYEEAKVLWTELAETLYEIFAEPINKLNDLLGAWKGLGGRDAFIDSIKNIYHAVRSYLDPIGEAWASVFPSMTAERLVELTKRFESFTAGLKAGEDRMERIRSAFEGFFGVAKRIGGILREIGGVIGFLIKEAFDLVSVFGSNAFSRNGGFFSGLSDALDWVSGKIHDFRLALTRVRSAIDDFESAKFAGVIDDYQKGYPVIYKFIGALDKLKSIYADLGSLAAKNLDFSNWDLFFGEAGGGIAGVVNVIYYLLKNILDTAGNIVHTISGIDIHDQIDSIKEYLHDWAYLFELLQKSGWFDKLKKEFLGVFDAFDTRFGSIASWFKPLKDAIKSIAQDFVEGIGMIFGNQNDFSLSFLAEGVVWLRKFVEESRVLGFIIETFKSSIEVFSAFAADFLSLSNAVRVFQEAGGGLAGVLAVFNDKLGAVGRAIADIVQRVTGLDISGIGHAFMLVIQLIEQGVLKLADAIARVFGWEDNPFAKAIDDSNSAFNELSGIFAKFEGINLGGLSSLGEKVKERLSPLSEVFKGFGDAFAGLWNVIKAVAPILGEALSFIGVVLNKLSEMLKDMSFSDILSLIKTGVMIKLASSISQMFGSIGGAFEGLQKKMRAETVHTIAVSVLEIAGAMLIISMIPSDKVVGAISGIGVALAGLIGSIAASMKFSSGADPRAIAAMGVNLLTIGKALIEIAIAMRLMVAPIEQLGAMEAFGTGLERMLKTLVTVTSALIILGALNKGGAISSAAKGIQTLVGALGLLFIVLEIYAHMNYLDLIKGLNRIVDAIWRIGGVLAILAGLTALLTRSNKEINFSSLASGFVKVALAMGVFALIIAGLSKMDFDEVVSSVGKLLVVIGGIAASMIILSGAIALSAKILGTVQDKLDSFASAMWKIGKTVAVIFGIVAAFGIVAHMLGDSADEFIDGAVNLIVLTLDAIASRTPEIVEDLMTIIVGILQGLNDNIPVIVRLLIEILGNTFHEFKAAMSENDFNFGDLLGGGGLIGGMLLLVIALKKIKLKPKDFVRAGAVLAGCALLVVELGTFLALIGSAAEATNAAEHIKKFETFAGAIGDVFGKNGAFTIVFSTILVGILAFAVFLEKIKKVAGAKNARELGGNIAKGALLIGEVIGLAIGILGAVGAEMAILGAISGFFNAEALVTEFKTLADTIASIFTGPGGIALTVLIASVAAAGMFFEKIKKVAGVSDAKEFAKQIWDAAFTIGEIIGLAVLILGLIGAEMALLGGISGGLDMVAGIEAFTTLADTIASFFMGPGGIALLTLVAAIAFVGIFLEKIQALAGAKDTSELAGNILQATLVIGELLGLAVAIITAFGGIIGGIGAIIGAIGVEEIKASIGAFNEFVNAILGLFYTTGENGQLGEPNGPVITMFMGLLAVVSALALVIGLTNLDLGSMSSALWTAVVVIIEVIAAIAAIVAVMGVLFSVVGGLFILIEKIPFVGEGGVVAGIQMFGDVMAALGDALGRFVGSLVGGVVEGFVTTAIPALADSLEYFAEHTGGFFEMIGELYDSGGLEAVGAFAAAILALVAASVIDGISDWLGCGVDDFADNLEYFAEHAGGFFELMKSLGGGEALSGAAMFADIVLKLTAASILDGLTGWLNGKASFTDFVDDLKEMMPAFADFVNNMPTIDEDTIANAKGVGEVLAVFAAADIPESGGLLQMLLGEKDFGKFGEQIGNFGSGLKKFQDETENLDNDIIDKAANAAGTMIELAKELPSSGGTLSKWLFGEKDFATFGNQIESFGRSMLRFQIATVGLDPDIIKKAQTCGEMMTELASQVPDQNSGWLHTLFAGDKSLGTFGENLETFGAGLVGYATKINEVSDWSKVEEASVEAGKLVDLAKIVAGIEGKGLKDFDMKSFGSNFKGYYDQVKEIDTDKTFKVADSVDKIVRILSQEIPEKSSNWFTLMNKNPMFMKTFGENLYSLSDYIVKYYERISTVDEGSLALLNKTIEPLLAMITDNIAGIERLNQGTVNRFGKALTTFGGFYLEFYNRIKDIDEQKANALSDALTETIAAFLWIDDQHLLDKINGVGKQVMDGILFLFGAEEIKREAYAAADTLVGYLIARFEDEESVDSISFAFFKMILEALSDQTLYEDMKGCGSDIADTIAEGIAERMEAEPDGLKGQLVAKLREIAVALEELEKDYINAGQFLGNSMVKGITDDKILTAASDAGVNFSKGLANGIRQGQNDVNNAAKVVTSDLVKETKKGLDEHSPSDVAAAIGLFYDKGLELGLLNGMDGIKEKVDMVTGLIKNGTYDGLSDSEIWDRVKDLGIDVGSVFGDGIYDWINSGQGIESIGNFIGEEFTGGLSEWLDGEGIDGFMESLSGEFSVGLEDIGTLSYDGGYAALENYDSGLQDYFDSGSLQNTMTDVSGTVSDAFSDGITSNFENGELAVQSYGDGLISGVEAVIPQAEAAGEAIRSAFNKYALFGVGDTFGYLYEEMLKMPDGTTSTSMVYDFDTLKMEQAELESYLLDYFNALGNDEKTAEIISLGKEGHGKFAYFLDYLRAHPDAYGRAELVESWEEPITVKNGVASVSDTQLQYTAAEMTKTEIATNDRLMEVLLQTNGHLVGIREDISGVRSEVEQLERMNVVMDTGTLVGVLTPHIDEDLNNRSVMAGRSVIG